MSNTLVRKGESRFTGTPNAGMTTLASPSLSGSTLSCWKTSMSAGATGPLHVFDTDQVWSQLSGESEITIGQETFVLAPGDTLSIPAGQVRQVRARSNCQFIVAGLAATSVSVPGETTSRPTPAWIA